MKVIIFILISFSSMSQDDLKKIDTCKTRSVYESYKGDIVNESGIEIISIYEFSKKMETLHSLMNDSIVLDISNVKDIIKCMNTLLFADTNYSNQLRLKVPILDEIEELYSSIYLKYLKCSNKWYYSKGGGIDFREFGVIYGGLMYRSRIFFITGISEYSSENFTKLSHYNLKNQSNNQIR